MGKIKQRSFAAYRNNSKKIKQLDISSQKKVTSTLQKSMQWQYQL